MRRCGLLTVPRRRAGAVCGVVLGLLVACAAGMSDEERAAAVQGLDDTPEVFATRVLDPPAADGVLPAADGEEHPLRTVAQPAPWAGGRVARFVVAADREQARAASIAQRAERRAFEGAPPVVPHDLSWGARDGCLGCHEQGMTFGERVARPQSHAHLTSCTQCHVARERPLLPVAAAPAANTFIGRASPGPGPRASPGAPPRMPHPTLLRTSCLSCHGEYGYPGLRTTHANRASCVQCHVSSAAQDQLSMAFR